MITIPICSFGWHPLRFAYRLRQLLPAQLQVRLILASVPLYETLDKEMAGWHLSLHADGRLRDLSMTIGKPFTWDVFGFFECQHCHTTVATIGSDAAVNRTGAVCLACTSVEAGYGWCLYCKRPYRIYGGETAPPMAKIEGFCTSLCHALSHTVTDKPALYPVPYVRMAPGFTPPKEETS